MSTHEVKVIRIENIRPHSNADSLEITDIWGYQCVIRKGAYQVGDLLAFIEPDYKVKLTRPEFAFLDTGKGKEWERITMRKFRGEKSYGLLVPAPPGSQEGDNVMELLEVERYEPPTHGHGFGPTGFLSGMCDTGPEVPAPTYDLENHKKFHKYFTLNEEIILSEKIHGCLHADTILDTDQGQKSISDIVNNTLRVKVKSFNHVSSEIEYRDVIDWMSAPSEPNTQWYEFELDDGTTIRLTGNHPVWMPSLGCYRSAAEMKVGDAVLIDVR